VPEVKKKQLHYFNEVFFKVCLRPRLVTDIFSDYISQIPEVWKITMLNYFCTIGFSAKNNITREVILNESGNIPAFQGQSTVTMVF
jgi:hypothetical protein